MVQAFKLWEGSFYYSKQKSLECHELSVAIYRPYWKMFSCFGNGSGDQPRYFVVTCDQCGWCCQTMKESAKWMALNDYWGFIPYKKRKNKRWNNNNNNDIHAVVIQVHGTANRVVVFWHLLLWTPRVFVEYLAINSSRKGQTEDPNRIAAIRMESATLFMHDDELCSLILIATNFTGSCQFPFCSSSSSSSPPSPSTSPRWQSSSFKWHIFASGAGFKDDWNLGKDTNQKYVHSFLQGIRDRGPMTNRTENEEWTTILTLTRRIDSRSNTYSSTRLSHPTTSTDIHPEGRWRLLSHF